MGARIAATRDGRTGCGCGGKPRGRSGGRRKVDDGDGEEAREPVNARSDGNIGCGAVRIPRGEDPSGSAPPLHARSKALEGRNASRGSLFAAGRNAANPRTGSRVQHPGRVEEEETVAVVENHEGGTESGWQPGSRGTGGDIGGTVWTPRLPNGGGAYFDNPRRGSPAWRASDGKDRNVSGKPARNDHEGGTAKRSNFAPDPPDGPRSAGQTPRERQVAQAQGGQGGSQRFPTSWWGHSPLASIPVRTPRRELGVRGRKARRGTNAVRASLRGVDAIATASGARMSDPTGASAPRTVCHPEDPANPIPGRARAPMQPEGNLVACRSDVRSATAWLRKEPPPAPDGPLPKPL
jgi:hypothetical protein